MAAKYQDYYNVLGVSRSASQDAIRQAYRKRARKYHPDTNKSPGAEEQFKKAGEAYEVLKDPEKRKRYDALGQNWKAGDDFTPPPGWEFHTSGGPGRFEEFDLGGLGGSGLSDFFQMLFGGSLVGGRRAGVRTAGVRTDSVRTAGIPGFGDTDQWSVGRLDSEVELSISLEETYHGARKSVALQQQSPSENGHPQRTTRNLEVAIPRGVIEGTRLRLNGGGGSAPDGTQGDLYLKVKIAPHPVFTVRGYDLETVIPVAPWEAALGKTVRVPTVDAKAEVRLPAGVRGGQRLRLRGKGLRKQDGSGGDLYVVINIVVPTQLSSSEKELFEELSRVSAFDPRNTTSAA